MKSITQNLTGSVACAICGMGPAVVATEIQKFGYLDKGKEIELEAHIPVLTCSSCNESYAAEGAEEAHNEAVCKYLGRMTPAEIRARRKERGLTQSELAKLTGAGIASIKRWEAGVVIQNASTDKHLRGILIEMPLVQVGWSAPQFRTQLQADAYKAAERFVLRMNAVMVAEAI